MSNIRLFERLTMLEDPGRAAGMPQDRLLRDSVARHLEQMLNTRAGSVPIDHEYGMPDMSNIAGSFALGTTESLSEAIIRQVARYEHRLRNARITVEQEQRDVITLRFELRGLLESEHSDAPSQAFAMTLRVNSAGRIFVEPRALG
ncbi:type VI secretion system baseplate subunit TssE [Castellaniella sp. GW247-6E4]|uniref:type VI secretion system baseplate subunit TssE n=1 Tax=Castellaniella sp. GW247-6E4 TaxID=3140380 RepID=UPI00331463FA